MSHDNSTPTGPGAAACHTHVVADPRPEPAAPALDVVRDRADAAIARFLAERRAELAAMDPGAVVLVDELARLVAAGGKRIRPALCYWAYRACGGENGLAIDEACAALELLHTFALIHDDVMDRSDERRGVPATHARFAKEAPAGVDPNAFGTGMAILVGDLAAVFAEQRLRTCGAPPEPLGRALDRFDRMRAEMAAGQALDLAAGPAGASSPRVAALKSGSYTAEGPVLIGAALASAGPAAEEPLRAYAGPLGRAFQLRDDVLDGDAGPRAAERVNELAVRARSALEGAPLRPEGTAALAAIAQRLALPAAEGSG
jgi:geranylgeranyl diphosphate synthase, type I